MPDDSFQNKLLDNNDNPVFESNDDQIRKIEQTIVEKLTILEESIEKSCKDNNDKVLYLKK